MKKFLTLMIGLVLSLTSFAQYSKPIDYPKFEVDSNGQQVLVMTIEQTQALDNATDLLAMLEKLNTQMGDYDSVCVKVINDKEKVIASQKVEISTLKESLLNKDHQIEALQAEVSLYLQKILILESEVANRQKVISEKDLQIRNIKTKMLVGGIGGTAVIIGLVLTILSVH
jgi:hypothetical protein